MRWEGILIHIKKCTSILQQIENPTRDGVS
jgi:hypothetical protein